MKPKNKRKGIDRTAPRCPYCGSHTILRSADGIYRENARNDMLYVCKNYPVCDSYVRVQRGTKIPLGTVANRELRELRAHIPDDLEIETLRSTDAGVAFYVKTNGASFYHAGDLNNWKWDGAGELVNGIMDVNYKNQIKKLAKKDINLAFVPFDPKLGMYQSLGMEYFLENTNAEYVFPMHMWQDYSGIQPFIKRLSNQAMADRIVPIVHENQVFEIREE